MKENYYNGNILELWLEEGILHGIYKVDKVDLQTAKMATQERLSFTLEKSYPVLTDYSKVKDTTKEARDYLSTEEPSKGIKAIALIIDSSVGKVIYNFFIALNKPDYPMQVFNDPLQAKEWLKKYR
ncbi:hypothetical protein GXP67_09300 [Rhodocytophaga rosea]|uniref:DUF7793 domain-containing protein n=1 Tax=Rhodocytophaga rosea TaxID=2704465 RepID=A0A6C0GGN4_9BACT|nr:hypothetical protein [Rhodocytophaga rosea]QHT66840.1 hypothetical protein GXP67_09300 [Rhodocytophaga rosea]